MSETVGATLSLAMRDAVDEAERRGVPREAAVDFMLGHLNIELASRNRVAASAPTLDRPNR